MHSSRVNQFKAGRGETVGAYAGTGTQSVVLQVFAGDLRKQGFV